MGDPFNKIQLQTEFGWPAVSGNSGRVLFVSLFVFIFLTVLCDIIAYSFYAIVILFSLLIIVPNKSKSSSKSTSAEAMEGYEGVEFASVSVIRKLLQSQERMFKNFVESVAASLTKRVDDLVTAIADLKTSLEFSRTIPVKRRTIGKKNRPQGIRERKSC